MGIIMAKVVVQDAWGHRDTAETNRAGDAVYSRVRAGRVLVSAAGEWRGRVDTVSVVAGRSTMDTLTVRWEGTIPIDSVYEDWRRKGVHFYGPGRPGPAVRGGSQVSGAPEAARLVAFVHDETGKPVEACNVVVQAQRIGTLTDADGRGSIENVVPGDWRVNVISPGLRESLLVHFSPGQAETVRVVHRFEREGGAQLELHQ
jgi:hypothetical protein